MSNLKLRVLLKNKIICTIILFLNINISMNFTGNVFVSIFWRRSLIWEIARFWMVSTPCALTFSFAIKWWMQSFIQRVFDFTTFSPIRSDSVSFVHMLLNTSGILDQNIAICCLFPSISISTEQLVISDFSSVQINLNKFSFSSSFFESQ